MSWDAWNNKPKLDEAKFIAPDEPKHRSRKDRKHWCRGKTGVEHAPAKELTKGHRWFETDDRARPRCFWWQTYQHQWRWKCDHELKCTKCGRVLAGQWTGLGKECPDYAPRVEANTSQLMWRRPRR